MDDRSGLGAVGGVSSDDLSGDTGGGSAGGSGNKSGDGETHIDGWIDLRNVEVTKRV